METTIIGLMPTTQSFVIGYHGPPWMNAIGEPKIDEKLNQVYIGLTQTN